MRKISADLICSMVSEPIENGVIILDESGEIIDITSLSNVAVEDVEKYSGIICPGFVNAHCHLELSYLKGKIEQKKGLPTFIKSLTKNRSSAHEYEIKKALISAENEMIKNGIVAVGDISNSNVTFSQKSKKNLHYHTFIEALGFIPSKASDAMTLSLVLEEEYTRITANECVSLVPHAPYSVSDNLFEKINANATLKQCVLSMHNQESEEENKMFREGNGQLINLLTSFFNLDLSFWSVPRKSSLSHVLSYLNNTPRLILVHNTFSQKEDIIVANEKNPNTFWCFCPNANLYIENTLPPIDLFRNIGCKIVLGTDSLASNTTLSILDEIKTIATAFPSIPFFELLQWATINGAEALDMKSLGKLKKGTSPGLNLIGNLGTNFQVNDKTYVQTLF